MAAGSRLLFCNVLIILNSIQAVPAEYPGQMVTEEGGKMSNMAPGLHLNCTAINLKRYATPIIFCIFIFNHEKNNSSIQPACSNDQNIC